MTGEIEKWVERYIEAVEGDPVISVRSTHFSCRFGLDMTAVDITVHVHRGRVEDLVVDSGPFGPRRDFVIRASASTWVEMARSVPKPGYQGIFAARATYDLSIDGNIGVLFQQLTCMIRQVELLRVVGVPPSVREAVFTHSPPAGILP